MKTETIPLVSDASLISGEHKNDTRVPRDALSFFTHVVEGKALYVAPHVVDLKDLLSDPASVVSLHFPPVSPEKNRAALASAPKGLRPFIGALESMGNPGKSEVAPSLDEAKCIAVMRTTGILSTRYRPMGEMQRRKIDVKHQEGSARTTLVLGLEDGWYVMASRSTGMARVTSAKPPERMFLKYKTQHRALETAKIYVATGEWPTTQMVIPPKLAEVYETVRVYEEACAEKRRENAATRRAEGQEESLLSNMFDTHKEDWPKRPFFWIA